MKHGITVFMVFVLSYIFIIKLNAQGLKGYKQFLKDAQNVQVQYEAQELIPKCMEYLNKIPNNPILLYAAARLNALVYNGSEALQFLEGAIEHGYGYDMLGVNLDLNIDPAFGFANYSLKMNELRDKISQLEQPVVNSTIGFTIGDRKFLPEGIAYDPVDKVFYLGSETKGKIIKVDSNGNTTDFTTENQDSLAVVLGLAVDPGRRELWACSCYYNPDPADGKSFGYTGVYKYNLIDGSLVNKYVLPQTNKDN